MPTEKYKHTRNVHQGTGGRNWRRVSVGGTKKKGNWLGHTLRSDDSVVKQALQWTSP